MVVAAVVASFFCFLFFYRGKRCALDRLARARAGHTHTQERGKEQRCIEKHGEALILKRRKENAVFCLFY